MKSNGKVILFTLISFLCGIWVLWFYEPYFPHLFPTRLWILEFPSYSLSTLTIMIGILVAGILLGRVARKYASQTETKSQKGFASAGIFLNVMILILPVLNLVSIFIPRTITGVVDFKIEGGYICVREFETKIPWGQAVNFDHNTVIYKQDQQQNQRKETVSVDAIQPGQVVEVRYIDNDTEPWGIKAWSVTILGGQNRPFQKTNCGNSLP